MKKALIIAAAAALAVACTGCGVGDVAVSGTEPAVSSAASAISSQASSSEAAPASSVDPTKYDDSLKGLATYLGACGYIEGNGDAMRSELIGAKSGYRYSGSVDKKQTVTAEFYEYDPANLNDTAKKVLDEVKQKGSFTLFEKNIPAVVSDSGKYLMIYKDSASGEANETRKKAVLEKFKTYKA